MTPRAKSRLDKLLLAFVIGLAFAAASYVHSLTSRFEHDLNLQAQDQTHEVARMAATLGALEDDIRALGYNRNTKQMELVQSSFAKAKAMIEDINRSHNYEPDMSQTLALQIAIPLLQDLSLWLTDGVDGLANNSHTVLRLSSQRVYLARVQLEQIYQQASLQTRDLLRNQSEQLKSFGGTVVFLLTGLLALLLFAGLLYARHRQTETNLWNQRKLVSDSLNNINEGFILADAFGRARVINTALPLMCRKLAVDLERNKPYKQAMQDAIDTGNLKRLTSRTVSVANQENDNVHQKTSSQGLQSEYLTRNGLYLRVTERETTNQGKVITFTDITDLKRTEDKLQRQANFDYLTNIANRSYYVERLQEALARAKRHNHKVALLQFDLDRFKQVNDTLGHAVGDELLIETANRIKRNLREVDLAARTGGDEFAAIIDQISHQDEVLASADRIMKELYEELEIDGMRIDFSASIGIAVYPDHAQDIDTLMQHADIACYRAKASGRNNYQIYGTDMKVQAMEQMTLETRLRTAIEKNQLFLDYQPHQDLATGELTCVEAFSRWQDDKLGLVSPAQFIPIADKNGLISKLGEQVLRKVFTQLHDWQNQGLDQMQVAINISQRQIFQPTLTDTIQRLSDEYQVDPGNLLFEITENVITDDEVAAEAQMAELAAMNIKFVLDDYGKGNSSLQRIMNLPIHALKIDGEFINSLITDNATQDIVSAMISSARTLQLDTIAECVETIEQVRMLSDMGCTTIQGYYVGPPQSPDNILSSYLTQSGKVFRKQA